MSTAVLKTSGAATVSGTLTYTGGSADYTTLNDASDYTHASLSAASATALWPILTGLPSDIGSVTGISIALRLARAVKGGIKDVTSVQIFKSDGTTAISSSSAVSSQTGSAATYTVTPSVSLDDQDSWDEAKIKIVTDSGTAVSHIFDIAVTITYTAAITEQYAVKNGNYNDTTVWSTGAVPTVGTVYSNNYTVTVNVNSAATVVTNVAGTVAVAGGGFALADGVTLTANCYAGAATCVTAGTGVGGAIVGDIYGGSSTNAYGFQKLGSVVKTVTITGDSHGGSGTGANGILNSSNGPINQTGNVYGGANSSAYGHRNSGVATDTITGNSYAGDAAYGAFNAGSGNITVTGYSYAVGSVAGSANASSGTLTISQNAIGGTSSAAYGAWNYGSGGGVVAVTGAAVSADSPGLGPGIANTGAGYATVGSVVTGTSGVSPCVGHVQVADLSAFTALVRSSASSVTLSAEVGLPSPFEPSPVFGGA